MTPAEKAARELCALTYNAISRRNPDATLVEVTAIIQAAIDEATLEERTRELMGRTVYMENGEKMTVIEMVVEIHDLRQKLEEVLDMPPIFAVPQPPEDAR